MATTPTGIRRLDDLVLGQSWGIGLDGGHLVRFGVRLLSEGAKLGRERFLPEELPWPEPVTALFAAGFSFCARGKSGTIRCAAGPAPSGEPQVGEERRDIAGAKRIVGENDVVYALLADAKVRYLDAIGRTQTLELPPVVDLAQFGSELCVVLASGEVSCFGDEAVMRGGSSRPGRKQAHSLAEEGKLPNIKDAVGIRLGSGTRCVLRKGHRITCSFTWGGSANSDLADTSGLDLALNDASDACIVDERHVVRCSRSWGTDWAPSPTHPNWFEWSGGSDVDRVVLAGKSAFEAGQRMCLLRSAGAVSCFGSNAADALGMKDTPPWSFSPVTTPLTLPASSSSSRESCGANSPP